MGTLASNGADQTAALETLLRGAAVNEIIELTDAGPYYIVREIDVENFRGTFMGQGAGTTTIICSSNPPGTGDGLANTRMASLDNLTIDATLGNRTQAALANAVGAPWAFNFWVEPDGTGRMDVALKGLKIELRGAGSAAGLQSTAVYNNYAYEGGVQATSARDWDRLDDSQALLVERIDFTMDDVIIEGELIGGLPNTLFGVGLDNVELVPAVASGVVGATQLADDAASSPSFGSGASVSISAPAAGDQTLTDTAGGFAAGDVGRIIQIRSTVAANRGSFAIVSVPSATTVTYTNAGGALESGSGIKWDILSYGHYDITQARKPYNGNVKITDCTFTNLDLCAWVIIASYGKHTGPDADPYTFPAASKSKTKVIISDCTLNNVGVGLAEFENFGAFIGGVSRCSVIVEGCRFNQVGSLVVFGEFRTFAASNFAGAPANVSILLRPKASTLKWTDNLHDRGPATLGGGDGPQILLDDSFVNAFLLGLGAGTEPMTAVVTDNITDMVDPPGYSNNHMRILGFTGGKFTDNVFKGDGAQPIACIFVSECKLIDNNVDDFNF